eukprot:266145-Ditylum_brightwellii.AAC.1
MFNHNLGRIPLALCWVLFATHSSASETRSKEANYSPSYTIPNSTSLAFTYGESDGIVMPPGCTCEKSGVKLSQCDAFSCDCNCDLTA